MLLVTTLAVAASRRVVSAARSFDPLSSSSDKLVDFVLFFLWVFATERRQTCYPNQTITCASTASAFFQNAQCFFEVTNLSGIDNRNNMSGTDKFENQAFFVPSGVYEHYQTGLWIRQRFDQY